MANGKSDIKLVDDFDGQVKVEAPDFCVDGGPGRRQGSDTPYRRALVHDGGDGLTVNWANDYRGGVTINGVKTITGHAVPGAPVGGITVEGGTLINLNAVGLIFKGGVINLQCQPDPAGAVKITGNVHFDKDVTIDGQLKLKRKVVRPGQQPTYDLADEVHALNARVAALELKLQ